MFIYIDDNNQLTLGRNNRHSIIVVDSIIRAATKLYDNVGLSEITLDKATTVTLDKTTL